MNPLFTIVVYFVVFRYIFRMAIPDFLGFFLLGFLMWIFFSRPITARGHVHHRERLHGEASRRSRSRSCLSPWCSTTCSTI